MSTHTETIARWACNLTYDDLTPESIEAAKRFVYDSLGCALGGFQTHDCEIFLEHEREMGSSGTCTVIGAGDQVSPTTAAMLNSLMIRAMDYNDIYWKQDPSHPSDVISGPIALAQRDHLSGKELGLALESRWKGTIARVTYDRLRSAGVHGTGPPSAVFFSGMSWRGRSVPELSLERLYQPLKRILKHARELSVKSEKWFGHDWKP